MKAEAVVADTPYGPEATRIILTAEQQAVLEAVDRAIEKRHYPPTIRELMQALGYKTTSGVHYHLVILETLGYLGHEVKLARGLWLTEMGKQWIEAQRHA
jgi:repressor LexA